MATSAGSDLVLERLNKLHPKLIDLGLDRVETLLARLGHPERRLAPTVHVAGTNGKGSTIAFLRAFLEADSRKVQVYSSPHLVRFHERIRLASGLIDEAALVALLERCETVNDNQPITYFEITTIAAFLAFAKDPADCLLLETGLGGRLDATNVLAAPRLTVITPISIDHCQFLGDDLASIAREKAGILKPGVAAVIAPQEEEALAVIEARARDINAPLYIGGRDWHARPENGRWVFEDRAGRQVFERPRLSGLHQIENAGLALAAAGLLGDLTPSADARAKGLAVVDWPARLQRLTNGPLVESLGAAAIQGDWELWLDGGHNAAAGRILAETLAQWQDRPVYIISGMMNSKAAEDFLRPLSGLATSLEAVTIPGEANAFSAEETAERARAAGHRAVARRSVAEALAAITAQGQPGRIMICGSLYLAGRILTDHS